MTRRRYTTRDEDAAYVLARLMDATRAWEAGDRCRSYDGRTETTLVRVDGEIAHLANGDAFHVSKMRRPS